MNTILATTSSFGASYPEAITRLEDLGYCVKTNPYGRKLTEDELAELLAENRPVGLLAGTEPVTGAVLKGASSYLKVVSRIGVGWDNVDHGAAKELGIPVYRTEGVLDQSVAELTLGMILNGLRHVSLHDREMRAGVWKKHLGGLLSTKTVGVVGYGAIGQRVAALCRAFGASVVYHDIQSPACENGIGRLCLEDLLKQADIVTVHASGSECILDADKLGMCKPGAIFVNTARGGMIDEKGLAEGIRSGRIGGACLDVFDAEPYSGELLELDAVVVTSHIGSYAREARLEMEQLAVDNLLKGLGGL